MGRHIWELGVTALKVARARVCEGDKEHHMLGRVLGTRGNAEDNGERALRTF